MWGFSVSMAAIAEPNAELRAVPAQRSSTDYLWIALAVAALIYAFLSGLRTVSDFDIGWQMATGRWIVQHHQIPSSEVFSYTAPGQPWIYPVGSGLLFYGTYALGGWTLLSWLGAIVCVGTVGAMLRRASLITVLLAIIAVPRIAQHTAPRADMFTLLLFTIFLSLLWRYHETGQSRLYLLPPLMVAWVNLHLGFVAGLALLAAYIGLECLDLLHPRLREEALRRLRRAAPIIAVTVLATLANPWGWGIYRAVLRQNAAMSEHSKWITEWASAKLSWSLLGGVWSLRDPGGANSMLLVIAIVAVGAAIVKRNLGAAVLIVAASWLSLRHVRFQALFAVTVVVVGGAVLASAAQQLNLRLGSVKLKRPLAWAAAIFMLAVTGVRSYDLVSNRAYLGTTELSSFGGGLSWWFPQGAAAFIERENIPGQVFNSYNEGGYVAWRLGQKYPDYIDGRAIPFGADLFQRNGALMLTPPDSPEWQAEADQYDINAIIVPLARYNALQFFPVLRQFCSSELWRPVYLDEFSAVFLRRTPQTEPLINRLTIDCATAALPVAPRENDRSTAFNQWANAAAVLKQLGRNSEAFEATTKALAKFPQSAYVHFVRGNLIAENGDLPGAEQEYLTAAALEANGATWSALADLYRAEHRLDREIWAREQAIDHLPEPAMALLSLGYAYIDASRPADALHAFDKAQDSVSPNAEAGNSFLANLAHGRSLAYNALGNLKRAVFYEEQTVRLSPDRREDWLQLSNLYLRQGRLEESQAARQSAAGR
jgi:tetratricopeptide (TPR) repeat protein